MSRSYWIAAGALVLAWIVLASPWLSGAVTIPWDARAHFQAQIQFLAQALHNDQTPFWSPNVFAGSPQIADPQSMMFSPAILLALFDANPSFQVVDTFMFSYLLFGGLAVLMLFKDRRWHPVGALIAALAFSFGASASSRIQHFGQIHSLAFFIISLWLLERTLRRSAWWSAIFCGLSIGMMLAEPDQVGLLACYILAGRVLYHWLDSENRWAAFRATIFPLVGVGAIAGLVAAVPVMLTWLFLESSNRPSIAFSEAVLGSMHPASLLTSVVADLFGAINPNVDFWGPSSKSWSEANLILAQNMGQVYIGAVPIIAVLAFGLRRDRLWRRDIRFFSISAVLVTLYALGCYTPFFKLVFRWLPGVDMFRRPSDATFMMGAMLAIVGGYVVHRIVTDGEQTRDRKLIVGMGIVGATIGTAVVIAIYRHHIADAMQPILMSLLWSGFAVGGLLLLGQRRVARAQVAVMALAAAFMVGDLATNQGPNESTALSPKLYDSLRPGTPNETIHLIKSRLRYGATPDRRDRVELVGLGFHWPNTSMVHGFDSTLGYNPLRIAEFADATGAGDQIANPEDRRFTPLFPSYRSLLSDMLGLRLIISPIPIEQVDKRLKPGDLRLVDRTVDGYVYENPRALPRVLFANKWQSSDFEELIKTGAWPDFDPRQTVLLENDPDDFPAGPAAAPEKANVGIVSYKNGRIELTSDTREPGFVILNDSWHPWWYATVDGEDTPCLKANVLFRAVRVPAGKHKIVFEFRPFAGAVAEIGEKLFESQADEETPDAPRPVLDGQAQAAMRF